MFSTHIRNTFENLIGLFKLSEILQSLELSFYIRKQNLVQWLHSFFENDEPFVYDVL